MSGSTLEATISSICRIDLIEHRNEIRSFSPRGLLTRENPCLPLVIDVILSMPRLVSRKSPGQDRDLRKRASFADSSPLTKEGTRNTVYSEKGRLQYYRPEIRLYDSPALITVIQFISRPFCGLC